MKKQLILLSDMEGASGIFDWNGKCIYHGTEEWRIYGKDQLTSDILAVCEAANEFGIDEIFYYDGHCAGSPEHNVWIDKLPKNVIIPDTPDRCFFWRRIRGQAVQKPFGLITVGQHARYGEPDAYFPHTIQSPPIRSLTLNGVHIAEIGTGVLNFLGTPYIANIGCAASEKEAREMNPNVKHISVKSKKDNWEPSSNETYPLIKKGVLEAISNIDQMTSPKFEPPFYFELTLTEGYKFKSDAHISWKGELKKDTATWESPDIEIGLEIFNYVRDLIVKV